MKSNLFTLVKIKLRSIFKVKNTNKTNFCLMLIFGLFIGLIIMASFGSILYENFEMFKTAHLENFFLPFALSFEMLVCFIFSVFMTKSWLFESKDNDLLLSLPVTRGEVLASRLISIILYNFVISLLLSVPIIVICIMNFSFSFNFLIIALCILLFITVIPTVLASLFGYLVAFIISKSKYRSLFEVVINFLFIVTYLGLIYGGGSLVSSLISDPAFMQNIFKYALFPVYLLYKAFTTFNIVYSLLYVLLNIVVFAIFVFVLKKSYFKILSNFSANVSKANYDITDMKQESSFRALVHKELKRYFGTPIYIFNTAFGVIMFLISSIASFFVSKTAILSALEMNGSMSSMAFVFMIVLFVVVVTNTTSVSISLEGSNFWILKSSPVNSQDVFLSKVFVNILIVMPIMIVGLLLFSISGYITIFEAIILILVSFAVNIFVSLFGLLVNLMLPNLSAESDTAVIKKSASSLFGVLIPMFIAIVIIGLMMILNLDVYLVIYLTIGTSLVLSSALAFILSKYGVEKYKKLS